MFFGFFRNRENEQTRWFFFNRNRAIINYQANETTNNPLFGFTEAISYNHKSAKGFAPVVVAQVLNQGLYPKAGVQYAHTGNRFQAFTWLFCETLYSPNLDHFLLLRYTPVVTRDLDLFLQAETGSVFPTLANKPLRLTQRLRLGWKGKHYQAGAGGDFNQTMSKSIIGTFNIGCFIRYEFKL